MAKMTKMAKCSIGASNSVGMNILMLVVYLVVAYIIYQVVMYFVGNRPSAMPDVPPQKGRVGGGCSTGTCGAK
jgi:hypothetical protein